MSKIVKRGKTDWDEFIFLISFKKVHVIVSGHYSVLEHNSKPIQLSEEEKKISIQELVGLLCTPNIR